MTQPENKLLELLTDFSVAARRCVEAFITEVETCESFFRPALQRVRLRSGIAQGDEILEMDICVTWFSAEWQPAEPSARLREEMKTIMVKDLGNHFSALETGEQRAFKVLINALLAQLSICDLMVRQAKGQYQTRAVEKELIQEVKDRAEKVMQGAIKIATTIATGERFDMRVMNLFSGTTEPMPG